MEPEPWPERFFLTEGPLPCLPMAVKLLDLVPADLMLVGRLQKEGQWRSFFLFWSCVEMGQEYHKEVVHSKQWCKASESAPAMAQCPKMDLL